jgi:hypothetical protein
MPLLARLALQAELSPPCGTDRIPKLIRLRLVPAEIGDVVVANMQLPFSDVTPVLALRVVLVRLKLARRENPVPYYVAPHSNPDEHVAAPGLYLLEVHPERLA